MIGGRGFFVHPLNESKDYYTWYISGMFPEKLGEYMIISYRSHPLQGQISWWWIFLDVFLWFPKCSDPTVNSRQAPDCLPIFVDINPGGTGPCLKKKLYRIQVHKFSVDPIFFYSYLTHIIPWGYSHAPSKYHSTCKNDGQLFGSDLLVLGRILGCPWYLVTGL